MTASVSAPSWRDDDVPVLAADVCIAVIDGEAVLYDIGGARSMLVNSAAAAVIAVIDGRLTVSEIAVTLAAEFAVDRRTVRSDLESALSAFEARRFVSRFPTG